MSPPKFEVFVYASASVTITAPAGAHPSWEPSDADVNAAISTKLAGYTPDWEVEEVIAVDDGPIPLPPSVVEEFRAFLASRS